MCKCPQGPGGYIEGLARLTALACQGLRGFLGHRTFSVKISKVPGKPGQVGHPGTRPGLGCLDTRPLPSPAHVRRWLPVLPYGNAE